jgi:hypothetical protein
MISDTLKVAGKLFVNAFLRGSIFVLLGVLQGI